MDAEPYLRRPYMPTLDDQPHASSHSACTRPGCTCQELVCTRPGCTCQESGILQQDLSLRPFYNDLTDGGLAYIYAKLNDQSPRKYYRKKTSNPRHVIVVGAGMAGLSASFELAQSGHTVTILEAQHRVGGRVKTIYDKFAKGLHAEGGAMRLPKSHFLTKHYVDLFNVKTRMFQDENPEGYLCFYGEKVKMSKWNKNSGWYCDRYWPGWDKNLTQEAKSRLCIDGINKYWECTVEPVIEELRRDPSPTGWEKWVERWSRFSVLSFLESDILQDPPGPCLRPWSQQGIEAYRVRNYMPMLRCSLVEFLRDLIGGWWKDPLYTPAEGMESLAWAFMPRNKHGWNSDVCLDKNIRYGVMVEAVEEIKERSGEKRVKVTGQNAVSKEAVCYTADAVIITCPLTVLRQMQVPLSLDRQKAVEGIFYEASTKILLQCKTRFWQKDGNLQGGFSKTNLPIGQLHYPDWQDSHISPDERGILVIYTWQQEAELFGAQTEDQAIENAMKQVATIHPEITDQFEVGAVQAWFNEPTAQGAFVFLRPNQYNDSMKKLLHSEHPVYLAGEALSWSNGWIQGAIESGLRAAYEFYSYNEKQNPPESCKSECHWERKIESLSPGTCSANTSCMHA